MPEPKPICGETGPYGAICSRLAEHEHRLHRGWSEDVERFYPVVWEAGGDPSMTEPTEPRIHLDEVVRAEDGGVVLIDDLPDDWPLGPVVVSTVPPDGLWPGPDGTWGAYAEDVPKSWQARAHRGVGWGQPERFDGREWVQCRPVPAPEPATERVTDLVAYHQRRKARLDYDTREWVQVDALRRTSKGGIVCDRFNNRICDVDDDGMVTVLRDADPNHTNPTPSVVPADSPDTGRWEVDELRWLAANPGTSMLPPRLAPIVAEAIRLAVDDSGARIDVCLGCEAPDVGGATRDGDRP